MQNTYGSLKRLTGEIDSSKTHTALGFPIRGFMLWMTRRATFAVPAVLRAS